MKKIISPTPSEMRSARLLFSELLRQETKEPAWQRFFAKHPFVLSQGLPLELMPCDIVPMGRPGKSDPDFLICPGSAQSNSIHGIVELKTHTSNVLRRPRKNILTLSADAQTAVRQVQKYDQLYDTFAPTKRILSFESSSFLFVVMSQSDELMQLEGDLLDDFKSLIPGGVRFIAYDELLQSFERKVPKELVFLSPAANRASVFDYPTLPIVGQQFHGRFHRVVTKHSPVPNALGKPYPGLNAEDRRIETVSQILERSSRFQSRFKPEAVGAIYGARSLEAATSEVGFHLKQIYGPAAKEGQKISIPMEHQIFQFEGRVVTVEGNEAWPDLLSESDFTSSMMFARRALESGMDGILYRCSRAKDDMLVAFNPSAVSEPETIDDLDLEISKY